MESNSYGWWSGAERLNFKRDSAGVSFSLDLFMMVPLASRSVRSPVMELPQVLLSMEVVLLPARGLLLSVIAPLPSLKTCNMLLSKTIVGTTDTVKQH
jgi:hypothetical protein